MTKSKSKIFYVDTGDMSIKEIREYLTKAFDKKREGDKTEV